MGPGTILKNKNFARTDFNIFFLQGPKLKRDIFARTSVIFKSFNFNLLVYCDDLIIWRTGQVTVKGSESCSQFIAGCLDTPACDSYCKEQYSGGNGICTNERCICNFECGGKPGKKAPKRDCEVNLGFCDSGGSPSCNDKCSSRYNAGTGYCDASIDPRLGTCTCLYVC